MNFTIVVLAMLKAPYRGGGVRQQSKNTRASGPQTELIILKAALAEVCALRVILFLSIIKMAGSVTALSRRV